MFLLREGSAWRKKVILKPLSEFLDRKKDLHCREIGDEDNYCGFINQQLFMVMSPR